MTCRGGFSIEESTRRTWYDPEFVLRETGLTEGMVFADIGCGEGFFSILAANIVGAKGAVYALDIDARAIDRLRARASEKGLVNVHAVTGAAEDTVMCSQCVDAAFLSMVLHDFDHPEKVLVNIKQMLKPHGLIVNLDWKKKQMDFGPPVRVRFSEEKVMELLEQAGFTITKVEEAGPYHYIVVAELQ